jgi:gamma-glutamyl:cysteine ligase YbdK (ATP-grasp superfamily)
MTVPEGAATLEHLRLHNGTIWRWNRPLIGFDDSGTPHFRIEHRVLPSGPSVVDMIANAALYFGLVHHFAGCARAPETRLPFERARENLYRAAREGLASQLTWLDGTETDARTLLLDALLPVARIGLSGLGLEAEEIDRYLGLIEARVRSGQTGAAWLRRHHDATGWDFARLTSAYLAHQRSGAPVHEWPE